MLKKAHSVAEFLNLPLVGDFSVRAMDGDYLATQALALFQFRSL